MVKLAYDYSKIKGKIKEVCGTQHDFAQALGLSDTSLSYKLNNISSFTRDELDIAVRVLNLKKDEIWDVFFTREVEKNSTDLIRKGV